MSKKKQKVVSSVKYFITPEGAFLCVWYALLFSVLEGLEESGVKLTFLENYDATIYKMLKKFRNAVFHTPSVYWDKRFVKLFEKYETDNESKIEKLHKEVALKLQVEIRKYNAN